MRSTRSTASTTHTPASHQGTWWARSSSGREVRRRVLCVIQPAPVAEPFIFVEGAAMRAMVMTSPGGSEFSEVRRTEDPRPGPGEVAIDVEYAGLNFMDVMARRGDPGYATDWPYVAGIEVSGT